MDTEERKRLFFGLAVEAPWPLTYPKGRIIEESARHITLAFLGNHSFSKLEKGLPTFPKPSYKIGPVGIGDHLLFLPKYKPRVVAEHVDWITDGTSIESHHQGLLDWLEGLDFPVDRRPFLPHVTMARAPVDENAWEEAFSTPLPLITTGIHLYESIGHLRYLSIWHHPLLPAFEEFEHTADIAFFIHGQTYQELYSHGAVALGFKYPPFLRFLESTPFGDLDAVVKGLNRMISTCDVEIGCPFKAVSYHGKYKKEPHLIWEMIVDV